MEDQNTTNNYEIHQAAYIFPRMSEEEFEQLKNDIAANGQQTPILLHDGKGVDGRHRLRACEELGIDPQFDEIVAANDTKIEQVVVSINLHRRHLTDSQKALIAARLANLGVGSNQHTAGAVSQKKAAEELGISVDSVQRGKQVLTNGVPQLIAAVESGTLDITNAARIAKLSRDEQVELTEQDKKLIRDASKAINRAKFEERRQERLQQIEEKRRNNRPLDTHGNTYSVIYADPPWDYMGEEKVGYPCMSVEDICKEPVNDIAEEDAALFMWCSSSLLAEAIEVIKVWGFKLKTSAVWDKGAAGQGAYFRQGHEILLLATRGSLPEVPYDARPESVLRYPRLEHSRKPREICDIIDDMYPELRKIELFCRGEPHPGWDGWGNECTIDIAPVEQETIAQLKQA